MHTSLLRTFALGLLIAVLAACSGVDSPTVEETEAVPVSESEVAALTKEQETAAHEELGTLQGEQIPFFSVKVGDASARPDAGACFYTEPDYAGDSYCLTKNPGSEPFSVPSGLRSTVRFIRAEFNDTFSSVHMPANLGTYFSAT